MVQEKGVIYENGFVITTNPFGWQLCPKCGGVGRVNAGPGSINVFEPCPVCAGKMIINLQTGKPPQDETQSAL
jgi:DnaJ-class molecular chaperone